MPDLYQTGDYDLAGFHVGVVEKRNLIDGHAIAEDDIIIGLASSGVHSNGFSLVRKIVFESAGHSLDDHIAEFGQTIGEQLLTPTTIYVSPVRQVLSHYKVKNVVHGIAHITGGGLAENIERILPADVNVEIRNGSWDVPVVFPWLKKLGNVQLDEMYRVFNMGIGMVLIVRPFFAENVQRMITDAGIQNWAIGKVVSGRKKVKITGSRRVRKSAAEKRR